jgi:diguanylate cyclase (GGDEF)-like protein
MDDDVQNVLVRSPLFRGVPASLVAAVAADSEARLLAANERLLAMGGENDKLHVIVSGSVSDFVDGLEGPAVHLGAGECVGELSLLDGRPVSADVLANESTVVLSFGREQVWALIDSSAELGRNLLRVLAHRVRQDDSAITASSRLTRYFERLATVDGLTGLRNRRWLDDAFTRQLERAVRIGQPVTLMMIDLDHFKKLNDEHGHLVGDAVLGRVGEVLTAGLRPQDLLARYGGEEFAVLLPGMDARASLAIAERLRLSIEHEERINGDTLLPKTTISLGLAESRPDETLSSLLVRADGALYRAKRAGRNCTSE